MQDNPMNPCQQEYSPDCNITDLEDLDKMLKAASKTWIFLFWILYFLEYPFLETEKNAFLLCHEWK